jgi:sugar fermentation stimulation protein A
MFQFPPLHKAVFLKRYKRFFADVRTEEGVLTLHTPNTGTMKGLLAEGSPVLYSLSDNEKRKLKGTLEAMCVGGEWLVVNTHIANRIAENAVKDGEIPELGAVGFVRREFPYGDSRIDLYVESDRGSFLIEVKNCTLYDDEYVMFPDAVTVRGRKHLGELENAAKEGYRACMLYMCQVKRPAFRCASEIDPAYAEAFERAKSNGVEMLCYATELNPETGSVRLVPL